jgi:hypothetical protein
MYRLGAYFTALAASEAAAEGRLLAVALDGKTLRGARRAGAAAAHLVSVFAHRARLMLVCACCDRSVCSEAPLHPLPNPIPTALRQPHHLINAL